MILQLTHIVLVAAHILAAAAWFGAMFYSLAVLHPRARAYFASLRQLEEFITFIAAGARWKVLFGCAVIGATGLALIPFRENPPAAWHGCLAAKTLLFSVAIAIFAYASWVVWPARLMAAPDEIPVFQYRFRIIAVSLIVLVVLCFLLSVIASHALA